MRLREALSPEERKGNRVPAAGQVRLVIADCDRVPEEPGSRWPKPTVSRRELLDQTRTPGLRQRPTRP
jgi:hypothetical protein